MMNWRNLVLECIQDLCKKKKSKEFSLDDIYRYENEMRKHYPDNKHIKDKIRQQIQYLRNDGIIDFKNNSGWIHTSQLRKGESFILLEDQLLFSKPTKYSKPIAKISLGRLLLVKKCKLKWCKVKTESYSGWIQTTNIWGTTQ